MRFWETSGLLLHYPDAMSAELVAAIVGGVAGAVAGGVVSAVAGSAKSWLAPVNHAIGVAGRRHLEKSPVDLTVDSDLDVIYAGYPNWVGGEYLLPKAPVGQPPRTRGGFKTWVHEQGGWDVGTTVLAVTVVAHSQATVVMEAPVVEVLEIGTTPVGAVRVTRPVGGAAVHPIGFDVELDGHPEAGVLCDNDGPVGSSAWARSLKAGEVEKLAIRVSATAPGLWSFNIWLPVLVDDRRLRLPLGEQGRSFEVVGWESQPKAARIWDNDRWISGE